MLVCNFKHLKRILPAALALVILLLGLSYLTMGNTPFFRRIFDPTNFYNRLYYWKVGLNMFMTYFPFGIGHMNFKDRYLEFVDTVAAPSGLDVKQIFCGRQYLFDHPRGAWVFGLPDPDGAVRRGHLADGAIGSILP
jgi:hypothetical protein